MRYQSLIFLAVFSAVLLVGVVYAAGYGTSKISLTRYSVNVSQGGTATVGFTVSLATGSTWGTSVNIVPSNSYVTLSPNPSYGDPSYSGNITINVAGDTPPGEYTFNISATGDDPSTSPVSLIIYVSKSSSVSPIVTKPPTTPTTYAPTNYFDYIIAIFTVIVIALLASIYLLKKRFEKFARVTMLISIIISLASALYLLVYDSLLRTAGMLHYDILITFFIGTLILSYLVYMNKKSKRTVELVLGSLSLLFVLAMFLDVFLGLPLTSVHGPMSYSINYLFGFGSAGTGSTFGISLAFSLLLLSVTASGILALYSYLYKKGK
ncbi:MAG: hypothetical protein ACP5MT_00215 [Candidatus Acidifodinimicrobium sp.]